MNIKEQIINRLENEVGVTNIDYILDILDKEFKNIKYTIVSTDERRFISNYTLEITHNDKKDTLEIMIHSLDIDSYINKISSTPNANPINDLQAYKLMFTVEDPKFCSNLEIKNGSNNISIF